jgi:hypothetical protein
VIERRIFNVIIPKEIMDSEPSLEKSARKTTQTSVNYTFGNGTQTKQSVESKQFLQESQ